MNFYYKIWIGVFCLLLSSCSKMAPTGDVQDAPADHQDRAEDAGTNQEPQQVESVGSKQTNVADEPVESKISVWTNANNAFGNRLLNAMNATDNVLISPFSIERVMGMLLDAAVGDTADELQKSLFLPHHDRQMSMVGLAVEDKLKRAGKNIIFDMENRIWLRSSITDEYQSQLVSAYRGQFEFGDFDAIVINKKVEEATHGRIKDLIPPMAINENVRAVLVNALYFKFLWSEKYKFDKKDTYPEVFHSVDGDQIVQMMHNSVNGVVLVHPDYRALELGIDQEEAETNYVMRIILPQNAGAEGLKQAENALKDLDEGKVASIEYVDVIFSLPRFTISTPTIDLKDYFEKSGTNLAFDSQYQRQNHELSGFTESFAISAIYHKAFIAIDEDGGEASAASAVAGNLAGKTIPTCTEFKVDRPFLFEIVEKNTNTILFTGRFVKFGDKDVVKLEPIDKNRSSAFKCPERVQSGDNPGVTLRTKNPEVTGGLDRRIVQKVFRSELKDIKACCATAKGVEAGEVTISWKINAEGRVIESSVSKATFHDKAFDECLTNAVRSWSFPAREGNEIVTVDYPFVFYR